MANYINRYATLAAYTAEASARDNLGRTVSIVTSDGKLHYDGKQNPLGLAPFTIRVKFKAGYEPPSNMGDSRTLVDSASNIWDIYKNGTDWDSLFSSNQQTILYDRVLEVLGANTTGVTKMANLFNQCKSLTKVALFDTSNVTDASNMFSDCIALEEIPAFNLASIEWMNWFCSGCTSLTAIPDFRLSGRLERVVRSFGDCKKVKSGILNFYQEVSSQTTIPQYHSYCFLNCGKDTTTGAAELAQIPSGWK